MDVASIHRAKRILEEGKELGVVLYFHGTMESRQVHVCGVEGGGRENSDHALKITKRNDK